MVEGVILGGSFSQSGDVQHVYRLGGPIFAKAVPGRTTMEAKYTIAGDFSEGLEKLIGSPVLVIEDVDQDDKKIIRIETANKDEDYNIYGNIGWISSWGITCEDKGYTTNINLVYGSYEDSEIKIQERILNKSW